MITTHLVPILLALSISAAGHEEPFPCEQLSTEIALVEVVEVADEDGVSLRTLEVLKGILPELLDPPALLAPHPSIVRPRWSEMRAGDKTILFLRDGELNDYACRSHLPRRLQGGYPFLPQIIGPFELNFVQPSVLAGRDGLEFTVDYLRASLSLVQEDEPDIDRIVAYMRADDFALRKAAYKWSWSDRLISLDAVDALERIGAAVVYNFRRGVQESFPTPDARQQTGFTLHAALSRPSIAVSRAHAEEGRSLPDWYDDAMRIWLENLDHPSFQVRGYAGLALCASRLVRCRRSHPSHSAIDAPIPEDVEQLRARLGMPAKPDGVEGPSEHEVE